MYEIYAGSQLIYKDSATIPEYKLLTATLTLKENSAGSLEITLPPKNAGYGSIVRTKTTVRVFRDGSEYWRGRAINENTDFYNQKKITIEGAFAFFNDIMIPPFTSTARIATALDDLLELYNDNLSDGDRQIFLGTVDVVNSVDIATEEYMSMYDILKTYFIDVFNGGFWIRVNPHGNLVLDYKVSGPNANQTITFGKNLLDFVKSYDYSDLVTALIPLGPEDEETGEPMTLEGLSAEGVNGIYYEMPNQISTYGRFEKVVNFNDVEDQYELLAAAEDYMTNVQFANMTLELSALDLHYLDTTINRIDLYDKIKCLSKPHGVYGETWYTVTEMTLDLVKPENSKYILGDPVEKRISGTINKIVDDSINSKVPAEVKKQIDGLDWQQMGVDIVDADVIKAGTMEATFCFVRYMLVNFLETNFDAIDARTGDAPSHSHRTYIRIINEKIYFYEDILTSTKVNYEFPTGHPLYWTSIGDAPNAYTYFTYEDPCDINKSIMPSGITPQEFRDMFAVKVWATAEGGHHEKGYIGFSEIATQVMEPVIKLGVGDQNGYGIARITKGIDGLDVRYSSQTTHADLGFKIKNDGFYGIFGGVERRIALPIPYNSLADAQADVGTIPALTGVAVVAPGISSS